MAGCSQPSQIPVRMPNDPSSPSGWKIINPSKTTGRDSLKRLHDLGHGPVADQAERWKVGRLIRFAIRITRAIAELHRRDLLHGRITSQNVWVGPNDLAIVLWEPIDKIESSPPRVLSPPSVLAGKDEATGGKHAGLQYLAPELQDDPHPTEASDLYALGCLLYRLRFGTDPFQDDASDITTQSREVFPSRLRTAVASPTQAKPIDRVIAHAIAKNVDARFARANDILAALQVVDKLTDTEPRPTVATTNALDATMEPSLPPSALVDTSGIPPAPTVEETPSDVCSGTASVHDPHGLQSQTTESEPGEDAPPRSRRRRRSPVPVLAGMAAIPLLCVAIVMVLNATPSRAPEDAVVRRRPVSTDNIPSVFGSGRPAPLSDLAGVAPNAAAANGIQLVSDDSVLWAPPLATLDSGSAVPVPLDFLPPGPGMLVHLRLQDRLLSSAGQPLIQALAPESVTLLRQLQQQLHTEMKQLASVTIAFHPGRDGRPTQTIVARLREPIRQSAFLENQSVSAARTRSGVTIYASDVPDAPAVYFQGETSNEGDENWVQRWAVGPLDRITEVAERNGDPILLPGSLESLWKATDDRLAVNVLLTPNFLFSDARQYLRNAVPRSETELRRFLLGETSAVLFVADVAPEANYLETRFTPAGGVRERELLSRLRRQIETLAEKADDLEQRLLIEPSWQPIAERLPVMLRFLASQVRYDIEDRRVIANAYLPPTGIAQLSLGGLLALNALPAMAVQGGDNATATMTVAEMLDRRMSISFDQESLETAAIAIANEFNNDQPTESPLPAIDLRGNDLRLLGITQNQQIRDFEFADVPLRTVLTQLVLAANPDRTATGPNDEKQVLVWVTDAANPTKVIITTRPAALQGLELPVEFRAP